MMSFWDFFREKNKYVYHGSPRQDLILIESRISTHGREWVYAAKDPVMAALFVRRYGGDMTCQISRTQKGMPQVKEKYRGALDERYASGGGSIYKLSGMDFFEGQTSWSDDFVSEKKVDVFKEFKINNALDHLLKLESEGKLIILRK